MVCPYLFFCRKEATRTPDPYVPNVVRYQLRYFPRASDDGRLRLQKYNVFMIYGRKKAFFITKITFSAQKVA